MGSMQVPVVGRRVYPDRVVSAIPIATAARHSAQNIAFHEVGRQAIMADPDWNGGAYQRFNTRPTKGLAVARMAAHITYLSETALQRKFGRRLQDREQVSFGFGPDFQIESYLHHQGMTVISSTRFDANSYLYHHARWTIFDLAADYASILAEAFRDTIDPLCTHLLVHQRQAVSAIENEGAWHALNAVAAKMCSFVEIRSDSRPRRLRT